MPVVHYSPGSVFNPDHYSFVYIYEPIYDSNKSSYTYIANWTPVKNDAFNGSFTNNHTGMRYDHKFYVWELSYLIDFSDNKGSVFLQGHVFDDILRGGSGADTLLGLDGNDVLEGGRGQNRLDGGGGNDTLRSTGEADTLLGGNGNDRLVLHRAGAAVDGGAGNDTLFLQGADAFSFTDDTFRSIEAVHVGSGSSLDLSDVTQGVAIVLSTTASAPRTLVATQGADHVTGGSGLSTIRGQDGDDVIELAGGMASVFGDGGDDMIRLGSGGRYASGGAGNDHITGGAQSNFLQGDAGDDWLSLGTGYGSISGGAGNDVIIGSSRYPSDLSGEAGNDRIVARSGDAEIRGGNGSDKLFGGGGRDTFTFAGDFGRDEIFKFAVAQDYLDVSALASKIEDLTLTSVHRGADTQITVVGDPDPTHKIILHDVTKAELIDAGHFLFG
ncbi:Bifunctional hemolysin/adenylate cyclase (plasmid) [Methylobacterium bullatum]|uniref:Bifunctional hemolysin/adenylate cyclase n=2 Tax=Methylobacterium bullatum TaxID=570505 RepID=A0A679JU55_9HYPH|nr:Bifunctional hemolysin/adenylate cyclase [Methylobacterium bullatum]